MNQSPRRQNRLFCPVIFVLLGISACFANPDTLKTAPEVLGERLVVEQRIESVARVVPGALKSAGLRFRGWNDGPSGQRQCTGVVGAGWGGDGINTLVRLRPLSELRTEVSVFSKLRGGGFADDPFAASRNIAINIFVATAAETRQVPPRVRRRAAQPRGAR